MKKIARLIYILIMIFCIMLLPSCKKGKKELPTTEGYIELSKEKKKEINDNFKKINYELVALMGSFEGKYNKFTDAFECAAICDDYYYFVLTGRYGDGATSDKYFDFYNLGGTYYPNEKIILVYHNGVFSHNIEELFDLGILKAETLVYILKLSHPGVDDSIVNYSSIKNIPQGNVPSYSANEPFYLDIDDQTKESINKAFSPIAKSRSMNIDSDDYLFTDNYYCIGNKDGYYYFIINQDLSHDALIDPILYVSGGIRMYSPGIIWAYKDGEFYYPTFNYNEPYTRDEMQMMVKKYHNMLYGLSRYYGFKNMEDINLVKELAKNILSLRVNNDTWPNDKGFVGLD